MRCEACQGQRGRHVEHVVKLGKHQGVLCRWIPCAVCGGMGIVSCGDTAGEGGPCCNPPEPQHLSESQQRLIDRALYRSVRIIGKPAPEQDQTNG